MQSRQSERVNDQFLSMIGEAKSFLNLLEHISKVAPISRPILVYGERGTGKEMVAHRIHYLSPRWEKSFIKVNCAALSETLLESELFGHEIGAFTGASRGHKGSFERADGGTIFLDEIGATSLKFQEKLLRVLEYGEFQRVGGSQTLLVDVRVVAATNVFLPDQVKKGLFKADLMDRLCFDVVTLPPLRERESDVLLLAEHFAIKMVQEIGQGLFPGFHENARKTLMNYSWPGNIRELKNVIERSIVYHGLNNGPVRFISLSPFQQKLIPKGTENSSLAGNFKTQCANFETDLLKKALKNNLFNKKKAASSLGLSYDQFRGLIRKYEAKINDVAETRNE